MTHSDDILDMKYIESLPQPLLDDGFPVYDFAPEMGFYRIDVCGILQIKRVDHCIYMVDANGKKHYTDDFWIDSERWVTR